MDLAADNNRLSNLLQDWKRNNEDLKNENETIKKSLIFFRKKNDNISPDEKMVQEFYESQIEPEMRKSESDIVKQLEEFKLRLAKVQSNQRHI